MVSLLIDTRRQQQPVHRLDLPALGHEFARQPVEQFRMRGRLAADAKVIGRRHQAAAKVELPETVDEYARRQRMIGPRQPVGQLPAIGWRLFRGDRRQGHGIARLNRFAAAAQLAAHQEIGFGRRPVFESQGRRERGRLQHRACFAALTATAEAGGRSVAAPCPSLAWPTAIRRSVAATRSFCAGVRRGGGWAAWARQRFWSALPAGASGGWRFQFGDAVAIGWACFSKFAARS